ncbi:GNAT family N-acetyltransferase [Salipaludibacillus agaradhaerens]|jgi:ribosomal protein S18 acetylase RimI-like enzyme|uniref:GNAT family N-acetyltransferase n=1 Tax=Salipaludibacillus agaradhaerens TaxID=76935 RepID=UPI0009963E4D|nr:GNAT family N-acetyltransferase [Salipaludibacillus agaradhaerens]
MKVRQVKDAKLISQLNRPVQELHYTLYPEFFHKYNERDIYNVFNRLVESDHFIFLLLEEDEKAVGYAWIEIRDYPENPFIKGYKSLYVHQISIIEEKRHKGGGSLLMASIYRIAKEKDITIVELDYWVKNESAKNFYKKEQFETQRECVFKRL